MQSFRLKKALLQSPYLLVGRQQLLVPFGTSQMQHEDLQLSAALEFLHAAPPVLLNDLSTYEGVTQVSILASVNHVPFS